MLIADALKEIYKLYEGTADDPDIDSDDYKIRLSIFNSAINLWETQEGVLWDELYDEETGTTTGTSTLTLSSDFRFPAGKLIIYDANNQPQYYDQIKPYEHEIYQSVNPSKPYYFITGGDGAKIVNVNPLPATGLTWELVSYNHAHTYTLSTDTTPIEMSDPWFGIHWTLAQLFADDENTYKLSIHQPIATNKLANMRVQNSMMAPGEDTSLPYTNDFGFGV